MRVLQIANYKEGVGGISVQVKLLKDKLRIEGFECDILSTKGSAWQRLCSITRLLRIGKEYDAFHVHACSGRGFFPAVIGITVGRWLHKRIVLTYHGGGAEEFFSKHPRMVRHYLSKTYANIALSGFIGKVFDRYGLKYTVIPNIVEMEDRNSRVRKTIMPHLISIRTLAETYNIECTLKSFALVKQEFPEATLILAGDGPLRHQLEDFVRDNSIRDVTFVGQVNNGQIYHYLNQADIMVSSSWTDNMPVSILEGFNAGLLVIASNVGGIPYMIEDRKNGLLFNAGDHFELANQIKWAINNQNTCMSMIENARQSVNRYSWSEIREKVLVLFQ